MYQSQSYYRKCATTLDGFYRKLLPIDSPNILRAQVLRRLCYCILKVLKAKINKSEYKAKRLQFILWKRLTLFIRDLHDIIQAMKKCKKSTYFKLGCFQEYSTSKNQLLTQSQHCTIRPYFMERRVSRERVWWHCSIESTDHYTDSHWLMGCKIQEDSTTNFLGVHATNSNISQKHNATFFRVLIIRVKC